MLPCVECESECECAACGVSEEWAAEVRCADREWRRRPLCEKWTTLRDGGLGST